MSDSKDLHPIALIALSVACVLALSSAVAITIRDVAAEVSKSKAEPQFYTVHFDGIDYQDLSRHWPDRGGSAYRTKSGKRIEFRGNFYEVEQ